MMTRRDFLRRAGLAELSVSKVAAALAFKLFPAERVGLENATTTPAKIKRLCYFT